MTNTTSVLKLFICAAVVVNCCLAWQPGGGINAVDNSVPQTLRFKRAHLRSLQQQLSRSSEVYNDTAASCQPGPYPTCLSRDFLAWSNSTLVDPTTKDTIVLLAARMATILDEKPDSFESSIKDTMNVDSANVFVDEQSGTQVAVTSGEIVVVTFRGPTSWQSIVQEPAVSFTAGDFGAGGVAQVHSGMITIVDSIYFSLVKYLDTVNPSLDKPVIFTGHGTGGGIAMLAAAKITGNGATKQLVDNVITFGSPRVGDKTFKAMYASTTIDMESYTFRFVYYKDLMPLLPSTAKGYRHVGRMVYINTDQETCEDLGTSAEEIDSCTVRGTAPSEVRDKVNMCASSPGALESELGCGAASSSLSEGAQALCSAGLDGNKCCIVAQNSAALGTAEDAFKASLECNDMSRAYYNGVAKACVTGCYAERFYTCATQQPPRPTNLTWPSFIASSSSSQSETNATAAAAVPASSSGPPIGAIVGGVAGAAVILALLAAFLLWRKRKNASKIDAPAVVDIEQPEDADGKIDVCIDSSDGGDGSETATSPKDSHHDEVEQEAGAVGEEDVTAVPGEKEDTVVDTDSGDDLGEEGSGVDKTEVDHIDAQGGQEPNLKPLESNTAELSETEMVILQEPNTTDPQQSAEGTSIDNNTSNAASHSPATVPVIDEKPPKQLKQLPVPPSTDSRSQSTQSTDALKSKTPKPAPSSLAKYSTEEDQWSYEHRRRVQKRPSTAGMWRYSYKREEM